MIRIAICDDIEQELLQVENCLREYVRKKKLPETVHIDAYSSSRALMEEVSGGKEYDCYILDVLMPELDGIQLGEYIRKKQTKAILIYLSVSGDFFQQAFNIYAFQYQLKPLNEDKFCEILDKAFDDYIGKNIRFFVLQTKSGIVRIPFGEILYGELSNRTIIMHLEGGRTEQSSYLRQSFEEVLKPLLQEKEFLQSHKSFMVNLDHVRKLDGSIFELEDGSRIPISRRRITEVKKKYLEYLLGETPKPNCD